MMATILEIKQLDFAYGRRKVLEDINFSVASGCMCGLLGNNGSGKTTLLKCINYLLTPAKGCVKIMDMDIKKMSRKELASLIAMVPQNTSTIFAFSVLDIVVMGRAAVLGQMGVPGVKEYEGAQKVLDEIGIGYLGMRIFNELSGGERQMVMLARALYQDTKILLLDEPTSHLDFKNQYIILEMVKSLTIQKDLTTIITVHDPNLAGRYCNQIVMLNKGRILNQGASEKVFCKNILSEVYEMDITIENTENGRKVVVPAEEVLSTIGC